MHSQLSHLTIDFRNVFFISNTESWFTKPLPDDLGQPEDYAKVRIRAQQTYNCLEDVVIHTESLLSCGYRVHNSITYPETDLMHQCLMAELVRPEQLGQVILLESLTGHMQEVEKKAFKPMVAVEEADRLGNPMFPAAYESYRECFCEWVARACFMSSIAKREIFQIVLAMKTKKGVWRKGLSLLEV